MTAAALLVGAVGCSRAQSGGASVTGRSIDEVLAAHTDSLMSLPGVVGTAIGLCDSERCIKVLTVDSSAATRNRIPARLEGFRVVVEVAGRITPHE